MDNVFSVFRTNEIVLADNEGLDASKLIPIELGGKLKLPTVHQVNNKARIVSIMDLGKMLLHCAREGETHKVHELMSRGAPFTTDWLGTTPLHVAAEKNHISTCEVLLRAGISKDARTKVDRTPLHFAVFEGHEQIVQLLLRHSCDVNAKDMLKMTPLHWVQKGYKNIAKLLLQNGADPNAISKFSKTPISLAAELDKNDLYQELMIRNLQRSGLEQQQAAETLMHELNVRLKPDPELIIEDVDEMDIDDLDNTIELDVIQSSPESSTAFTEDFDSFSTTSNHQSNPDVHVKLSNKEANSASASTLALLKEHGIAMQEDIENTLITSALQSGRQLVLSDAGKLLLNDPKFKKSTPTVDKQSTTTLQLTTPSITTTISKTGSSTIKFENVKRKPAILTPSKTLPLETNKVFKVMSAEQFHLMVGNNGGNFCQSKTPNGLIRYQAIKNSNVITQLVKRKNSIVPNSKIKISPLSGTLKSPTKLDSSQSRISNFQSINTSATSTIPKETNSDILSRVSFNIVGNVSASTNLPQATTISTGQPYTVKLVSLAQTTAPTPSKPKTQIVRQFKQSVVQSRSQLQVPSTSNGTQMSDIEKQVIELQKLTDELRKQNEEYKFRLEKLENEKEREREERLSRQYTNT